MATEDYEEKRRKQVSLVRSVLDYLVGAGIAGFGVFMIIRDRWKLDFNETFPPGKIDKFFGVVCIAYGIWRMYRGYKKNYFR